MSHVKTFESFIKGGNTIKDKFGKEYNIHVNKTRYIYDLTVSIHMKVIASLKLEFDTTDKFWEIEAVDIHEEYRKHGLYFSMLIEALNNLKGTGLGIVSRKKFIHKSGARPAAMDTFWAALYNEQEGKGIIVTKKDSDEGFDYFLQLK